MFVLGVAAGSLLPHDKWPRWLDPSGMTPDQAQRARDSEVLWRRAGRPDVRHPVEVIRTVDGDTFEARVALWPGLDLVTRVRLRGVDAPELKAGCDDEFRKAEIASAALRNLLREGGVTIYNIGPDKYAGRVVADAATKTTANVSAALLAGGFVRSYDGGRRSGWCGAR